MVVASKLISNTLTWTGNKITKVVGKTWPSYPNGVPALTRIIEYSKTSPLAQMGINRAVIENAGKHGKKVSLYSGSDCLFSGLTNSKSYQEQFKNYCNAKRHLIKEPVSKVHHNELTVTTTASGAKMKRVMQRFPYGDNGNIVTDFNTCVYYPENVQLGRFGLQDYGTIFEPELASLKLGKMKLVHTNKGEPIVGYNNDFVSDLRQFINSHK